MKKILSAIFLITVITCVPVILYAQESPIQFTISGHQYRAGKTYTFPPEMQMLCNAQLKDGNTTNINGTAQFPPDNPTETVSLSIELFSGVGKNVLKLDRFEPPSDPSSKGHLTIIIMGPGGAKYTSDGGSVTIDEYGVVNGYLDGHFKTALKTVDENGNVISGYSVTGIFHVKRTQ
jgi:hypothetical protein